MKKNILPIFISAMLAFSLVGCGGSGSSGSSSGDNGFYYYNAQNNSNNSTNNNDNNNNGNNNNNSNNNNIEELYKIKTIYKTSEGYIADICQIPSTCKIAFPVCSEKNGKILVCNNAFEENQEMEEFANNLIKPFSIQTIESGYALCFTTIGPTGENLNYLTINDPQYMDENGNRIVKTYITSNAKTLKSPRYIVTPNLIDIYGVDFSTESSYVYSAIKRPDQDSGEYKPSVKSVVFPNAKFFNLLVYSKYIVAGNLTAEGGIAVFDKDTLKEITEITDEIKIKSGQTTGKYITGLSYDNDGNIVYSSFQNTNKLAIYKYNPDGEDTLLCSSDEIPPAYEIVRGYQHFQDKFIFTSCGSNGNQGIYIMNFDGTGLQRIIAPTKDVPMINPAKIIMYNMWTKSATDDSNYPVSVDGVLWWTCCGGKFDREKGEFTGSEGNIYFRQFSEQEVKEIINNLAK